MSAAQRAVRVAAAFLTAALFSAAPLGALAATPTPSPSHSPTPTLSPGPTGSPRATPRPIPNESVGLKTSILAAIDRRLGSVRSLKATVAGARTLNDGDRTALLAQLDGAASGLSALAGKVAGESDPAALRRDATAVVTEFRVDDLLGPKVHLVIAADYALTGAASQSAFGVRLQAAAARERAAGNDTRAAEALIADMQALTAAARSAAKPVPAEVLPLSATGFPANDATLKAARGAIATARSELHRAADDSHQVAAVLKLLNEADLKASGHRQILERLEALAQLTTEVRASKTITDRDRSALLTLLSTDQSGLSSLDRRIQADNEPKTLDADIRSIYSDYRVYALVEPKVELVLATATVTVAHARMQAVADHIGSLIHQAKTRGRDTVAAEAALTALLAHETAAEAKLTGVSADLLSLTTESYPETQAALLSDRRSIEDAHVELTAAGRDARLALQALK